MMNTDAEKVLVTGTAGFIGFHLARALLERGTAVIGIDGFTPYYDVSLKRKRHDLLQAHARFKGHECMLEDAAKVNEIVMREQPARVVHLAAQAGVRYSLENPRAYVDSNLVGTFNVLEAVRSLKPRHFLLASTSSVYGANTKMPFYETDRADHPLTLYAATKKSNELMAHCYAHLWRIPTTAFRFFTVYGPWGRPDMALFKFVDAMVHGRPIEIYGEGKMRRDFTYIDDLVEGIIALMDATPGDAATGHDSLSPAAPFRVVNIGGGQPVELMDFIEAIEKHVGRKADKVMLPMQPGDVRATWAGADLIEELTGGKPTTTVDEGVKRFVAWYADYYGVS
jgi:UDP-glucuronate 4-epimerase